MDDAEFFVKYVLQTLVIYPENVVVEKTVDEKGTLLSVTVDPSDMGRVIGKAGATANCLRHLLHALAMKHDRRYSLKIIDTNPDWRKQ